MESPSVFAGLLDENKGGKFIIQPSHMFQSAQRYVEDSNVLETFFFSVFGYGKLTDFMPIRTDLKEKPFRQAIYRKLECISGRAALKMEFSPRFDYGRGEPTYRMFENGVEASYKNDHLFLYSPWPLGKVGNKIVTQNRLVKGESAWFLLRYNNDYRDTEAECNQELNQTVNYWQTWAHQRGSSADTIFEGPAKEVATRSGLILKLLMNDDTGSIAAAATTSIPEQIGGERNWDYRFNWVRDASFTIQALYHLGHPEEARKHLAWFIQVCEKQVDSVKIKPLYPLNSDQELIEEEIPNLDGYRNSKPVRVGNLASDQLQLDVFGELINAVYETIRYGMIDKNDEEFIRRVEFVKRVIKHVQEIWKAPDSGIWEARAEPRHYVYSKVMCWVALDRAIKMATALEIDAPIDDWKKTMEEIRTSIMQNGFSEKLNSFVQYYGSEDLDATGLLIPILGFLPATDPKILGTIKAIKEKLGGKDYLLYRYLSNDGLAGGEGKFFLCSFWLVQALSLSGQVEEAEKVLFSMLKYVSPTGIISEEVDTETGELLGNFPQAFSHIGMINSLIYLYKAKGEAPKELSIIGTPEFNTMLIKA